MKWQDYIDTAPRAAPGTPVLRGTPLTVEFVLERLGDGASMDELLAGHPDLTPEHIRAAAAYAAEVLRRDGAPTAPTAAKPPPRPAAPLTTPRLPDGLSDEWHFDRDLSCPTCSYNLRMLHTPRCPECGSIFRWQALLDITCPRCVHSLALVDEGHCPVCRLALNWDALLTDADVERLKQFEYTRTPVRRAMALFLRGLWPTAALRAIPLESTPAVGRLRMLRRVMLAIALAGIAAALVTVPLAFPRPVVRVVFIEQVIFLIPLTLLLPVGTSLGLPLFVPTLARFRIRWDQLLRVAVYGLFGAAWAGLLMLLFGLVVIAGELADRALATGPLRLYYLFHALLEALPPGARLRLWGATAAGEAVSVALSIALILLCVVWWWVYLYAALRRFLRLDRRDALALWLSTQVIGALLMLVIWALNDSFLQYLGRCLIR